MGGKHRRLTTTAPISLGPVTNSAAILFKLADSIPTEQLTKDLSAGQLNGAIEALSNLELSEIAVALGQIRKDLEDEGDYESAAGAEGSIQR